VDALSCRVGAGADEHLSEGLSRDSQRLRRDRG
jgi:hypothetical protein